jgi:hypothetical protein
VRPQLVYTAQVRNPWNATEIEKGGKVQSRATTQILGMRKFEYDKRLKKLGLTLEKERKGVT